jgi:hypothetical protein
MDILRILGLAFEGGPTPAPARAGIGDPLAAEPSAFEILLGIDPDADCGECVAVDRAEAEQPAVDEATALAAAAPLLVGAPTPVTEARPWPTGAQGDGALEESPGIAAAGGEVHAALAAVTSAVLGVIEQARIRAKLPSGGPTAGSAPPDRTPPAEMSGAEQVRVGRGLGRRETPGGAVLGGAARVGGEGGDPSAPSPLPPGPAPLPPGVPSAPAEAPAAHASGDDAGAARLPAVDPPADDEGPRPPVRRAFHAELHAPASVAAPASGRSAPQDEGGGETGSGERPTAALGHQLEQGAPAPLPPSARGEGRPPHLAAEPEPTASVDRVLRFEEVRVARARDGGEMRLEIASDGLGPVEVRVHVRADAVHATLWAEDDRAREALAAHRQVLEDALGRSHLRLEGFTVGTGDRREAPADDPRPERAGPAPLPTPRAAHEPAAAAAPALGGLSLRA